MILKDKVVVITGASDGIGKEIAIKLAKEGCKLALVARNGERLLNVKNKCVELGSPQVECYVCDISINNDLNKTKEKIFSDFNFVDILLNVAGIWQKAGQLEEATLEEIQSVISINLIGLVAFTRLLLPGLKSRPEAAIINVCSRSGVVAVAGESVYSASKWGVTGFTEVLKADLKGSSVRVAGIYQGGTNTQLFNKVGDIKPEEKLATFINPQDLADVIVYMLSRPPKIWLHDVRIEY